MQGSGKTFLIIYLIMTITSSQIESFCEMWVGKLHLYCYLVNTLIHEEFEKFIEGNRKKEIIRCN